MAKIGKTVKKAAKPAKTAKAPKKAKAAKATKVVFTESTKKGKPSLSGKMGRTPARIVGRIPDELWARFKAAAQLEKLNFSDWARRAMEHAALNPKSIASVAPTPGTSRLSEVAQSA